MHASVEHQVRMPWTPRWFAALLLTATLVAGGCTDTGSQNDGTRGSWTNPSGGAEPLNSNNGKIWFLLDRSGSMFPVRSDVVAGFNQFVSDLRAQPLDCRMSLILFDGFRPFDVVFSAQQIQTVPQLKPNDYVPDGQTPFYDALGKLVVRADSRIANRLANGEHNEDQLVVILTDGLENASLHYSQRDIANLIDDRQDEGWTFVFLGANQDSYAEGAKIGLTGGNIQNFQTSGQSIALAYDSVSRATTEYCSKTTGQRRTSTGNFFGGIKEAETGS